MVERGDSVAALWRNAQVGRTPMVRPGDIRLLCEPAASEGTASSRAAGLKTLLLRTQVVIAGKWPSMPGVFATRVWRPRRQPQPALLATNLPMSKGGLIELLPLNAEDGSIEAVSMNTAAAAAAQGLKHSESSSTIVLAPEVAKTEEVAIHSKEKQDHIIVIEILKFVKSWQDDLHTDPTKLREHVEAIADHAKKEVKDFLIANEDRSAAAPTMMPIIHEQVTALTSRKLKGRRAQLQLGSLMVPLRRPSKGTVPLPGLPQLNSSSSKGSLSSRKGGGKGAKEEQHQWNRKTVKTEHVACLELPKPLDRLYLLLSRKDRPQGNKLETIRKCSDPSDAFADLLLGESRHGLHQFYSPDTATLVQMEPIVSRNFAAMTALFSSECEVAQLGALARPKDDLKMLCLWSRLQSLTYSDHDVTELSLLTRLEVLQVLELHDMGPELKCLADCNPPRLQHLTIRKCPGLTSGQNLPHVDGLQTLVVEHCDAMKTLAGMHAIPDVQMAITHCQKLESVEGLGGGVVELPPMIDFGWNSNLHTGILEVASSEGVRYIDLQGCPKLDRNLLLQAARTLKSRSHHAGLVCPSLFPLFTVGNGDNPMSPRMTSPRTTVIRTWGKNKYEGGGPSPRMQGGGPSPRSQGGATPGAHSGSSPRRSRNPWGNESGNSRAQTCKLSKQAAELLELFELASEAAEVKVQSAKMLIKRILLDANGLDAITQALAIQGEALRHLKEINGTPVIADAMKVDMLRLRMDGFLESDSQPEEDCRTHSRRNSGVAASLRMNIENIPHDIGCQALSEIGWSRDAAKELVQYIDVDHQGSITESDLALLFEHGSPASTEEMLIFHVWIMETFENGIAECYHALVEESPWGTGDLLSRLHFEQAVMDYGYGKSNSKAIFTCLDADRRAGFISANEFGLLRFFVGFHALKIADGFKKQLRKKYKTLEAAYKALSNEDGNIPMSELQDLAVKKWKIVSRQASCNEAYHFLMLHADEKARKAFTDMDGKEDGASSVEISRAGLMALEGIDVTAFRHDLRKLSDHIMLKYTSFDAAFAAFNPRKAGLTHEEFIVGYKHILCLDRVCDLDPDLLYHFLDLHCTGMVSRKAFSQLGSLSIEAMWDDIAENRDKLLRRFRGNATECFGRLQAILKEKKLKEHSEDKRQSETAPTSPIDSTAGRKVPIDELRPPKVQSLRALKQSAGSMDGGPSPKTPGTSRQRVTSGLSTVSDALEF